ncbi:MAG: DUF4159 domain-containing protein [Candidatus Riflebacteria bacterium]|nr:DUF4159 domain-containing protein [Candidatus Riflebacteria bacterium]
MKLWILPFIFLPLIGYADVPADGRFTVARLHYSGGGDWYGNETSWVNLMNGLNQRTTLVCAKKEAVVTLKSNDIFFYPFVTLTGHGNVTFSDDEAQRLRQYLIGGGFLWIDDDFGMDEFLRPALKRVFPEHDLVALPATHPIFHTVYEMKDGLPKIHEHHGGAPQAFGLFHQGRMVLFYSYNTDIGDGLEDPDVHQDPQAKREAAMKTGINIVTYALTH